MLSADFSKGLPDLRTGIYRHYKGPLYTPFGYGHDANDPERTVVVYQGLELTDAHKGPRLAVRTAEDFFTIVCSVCGKDWECDKCVNAFPVRRFEYLGPAWYGQR